MTWRIVVGDALERLRELPDGSVQTCVTSPPYFGLRDYGTGKWEGGDDRCDHTSRPRISESTSIGRSHGGTGPTQPHIPSSKLGVPYRELCGKCGARRVDNQLGLEPTPDLYVARLVEVFREVRRVLRDDGTVWLNLGDSYASVGGERTYGSHDGSTGRATQPGPRIMADGLKPKDLIGVPWMVAFALRADGWVLRQEVIWKKPNPMPESVTDRCTKSHEQIFMFSKGKWSGPEPGEFAHISEEDARWLALFFDAEGCLALRRERDGARHAAQVSLGSTCRELLEAAQRIVGAGNILERDGTNAPMYYWQLSNKRARDLLLRLYPHLIVKQRQARCLIDLESRKWYRGDNRKGLGAAELAYRERLWETVKSLNSFGDPDINWVPVPKFGRWTPQPYFYDADAIREDAADPERVGKSAGRWGNQTKGSRAAAHGRQPSGNEASAAEVVIGPNRNKRSVWTVPTQPFPGAHFAVFPPKLIEPCVLAGSSPRACGVCGAPWERVVERTPAIVRPSERRALMQEEQGERARMNLAGTMTQAPESRTVGWQSSCDHQDDQGSCVVLDPFNGAGTTGFVATRHGRSYIGIELNPVYAEMARERIATAERLGHRTPERGPEPMEGQVSIFDVLGGEAA